MFQQTEGLRLASIGRTHWFAFRGYIFCRTGRSALLPILLTPGVIRVVSDLLSRSRRGSAIRELGHAA